MAPSDEIGDFGVHFIQAMLAEQRRIIEKQAKPKKGLVKADEERREGQYVHIPAVKRLVLWIRGINKDGEEWEGPARTGMPPLRIREWTYREILIEPARRERRKQGSILRRLRFDGLLNEQQLWSLERWASDWHAAQSGVKSCLDNREGGPSADGAEGAISSDIRAWRAFDDARSAILAISQMAALIAQYVACHNKSPSASVSAAFGSRKALTADEAVDLVMAGGDALLAHYRKKP